MATNGFWQLPDETVIALKVHEAPPPKTKYLQQDDAADR
jgi:hypothetical protein